MRKESVSIIGGADGPTSIFLAGKKQKLNMRDKMRRCFRNWKKRRAEASIKANPHTLEEVLTYLKNHYGAVELSKELPCYREERTYLKQRLILQQKPELLKDCMDTEESVPLKENPSQEELKAWLEKKERERARLEERVREIPDEMFPIDFHIYEICISDTGRMQISIEKNAGLVGSSCSGNSKEMKKMKRISREISLYYGVTEEDIREKTERYQNLVLVLSSRF